MKKLIVTISIIIGIGILWIIDIQDRYQTDLPKYFSNKEEKYFIQHKTIEESQEVIKANWSKEKYQFPREEVTSVKFYKNIPLISRLLSKEITVEQKTKLIAIINDPSNFDWGETTWGISEINYFFRFYNNEDKEIGKIWICFDSCGMTEIRPWVPTTKYGALSKSGKFKFAELMNEIQSK